MFEDVLNSMNERQKVAAVADNFATDYTLVMDNDSDSYHEIMEMPETQAHNMSGLSDRLKTEFETYISEVVERERENGHEAGALLISQLLIGMGSTTFDMIARHYIATAQEIDRVDSMISLLKTGA
jgi:hypothetical protein